MIGWYVLNCNESFAMHTHTHTHLKISYFCMQNTISHLNYEPDSTTTIF